MIIIILIFKMQKAMMIIIIKVKVILKNQNNMINQNINELNTKISMIKLTFRLVILNFGLINQNALNYAVISVGFKSQQHEHCCSFTQFSFISQFPCCIILKSMIYFCHG